MWQEMNGSIQKMLSTGGFAELSGSTSSLTVRDKPRNINRIARYIEKMNLYLSQQVEIVGHVYEILLSKEYQNGINWNIVYNKAKNISSGFALDFKNESTSLYTDQSTLNQSLNPNTFAIYGTSGTLAGSEALINALSAQGKVITISQPRLTILNNQVGQINIINQQKYISKYASTATSFGSYTSVIPNKIITGFSLFILPKIKNNLVLLQLSSSMAKLVSMDTQEIQVNPSNTHTGDSKSIIQLPRTVEKYFTQRSLVESGRSLILSGFIQKKTGSGDLSPFGAKVLGQNGGVSRTSEVVVIMTPYIIKQKKSKKNNVFHEYDLN